MNIHITYLNALHSYFKFTVIFFTLMCKTEKVGSIFFILQYCVVNVFLPDLEKCL